MLSTGTAEICSPLSANNKVDLSAMSGRGLKPASLNGESVLERGRRGKQFKAVFIIK
jgi:hypothetical protein